MKLHSRTLWIALWTISMLTAGEARLGFAAQPTEAREALDGGAGGPAETPLDVLAPAPAPSIDDLLSEVARRVPAFGGMFIAPDGTLRIYLLEARHKEAAKAAIAAVFGRDRVALKTAQVVEARYRFAHLKAWHDRHRLTTLAIPGVVMTGIDKSRNRLRIGVKGTDVIGPVQRELRRLDVPLAAVEIVEMRPMNLLDTLDDTHRPLLGGLQIHANSIAEGTIQSTLGFLAVLQGQAGFVTCSHCAHFFGGGVQGSVFHQATISGAVNRIGVEIANPFFVAGSGCPSGRLCRKSDSAFVQRNGGPSQDTPRATAELGHIAFVDGALKIETAFQIIAKVQGPIDGESVVKIGRTTGHSEGVVNATCHDINTAINNQDTGQTLLCQDTFQGPVPTSAPGDSGSPVFSLANVPSTLPPVVLYGVLWGGDGVDHSSFSPISAVESELGQLRTFLADSGANSPPEVKIRQPKDQSTVGVGGLNIVNFQADIVDYEGCCQDVTWQSDKDGVLGHGAALDFTFLSPGARTVTVTATDNDGATASDSIVVTAETGAPTVSILQPANLQTVFTGFTTLFQGSSFDPNEPFLSMPCAALTWTSNLPADPFPVNGCAPLAVFQTPGPRVITLTGTDSFNLTASASITIEVVNAPPSGPPVVTILKPLNGDVLPASTVITLTGKAQDPANQSPLSYQWVLIDGATKTILGSGSINSGGEPNLQWKPSDNVTFLCGGRAVTLELDATNPGAQTGSATVDVHIGFPPC
ncbi:MAG TPA: hypothetical protein VHQ90_15510 [Thermoanaerobaculia bacterium]|nr:hypothetical protein [Thermoanaerobaculia bacterium]